MARWLRCLVIAASLTVLSPQSFAGAPRGRPSGQSETAGTLKVLTYNVAGLPEGLSRSRPTSNLPIIGELLNRYDLALVQEDFAYPAMLRQAIRHLHGSPPFVRGEALHLGDGLSHFARLPFHNHERETWRSCHGVVDSFFDCLTPKGLTYAKQELAPGVFVDVYNVHTDAGRSPGDRNARAKQLEQLAQAILRRSTGQAVIVAGDFNLSRSEQGRLAWLEKETGLLDTCKHLRCRQPSRVDRVLFRSSEALELAPRAWRVDERFVDASRRPLSDHLAVAIDLDWALVGVRSMGASLSQAREGSDKLP